MNPVELLSDGWAWIRGRKPPGGIRPAAHKTRSLRSVIMATPIPEYLVIPLSQYQRAAANAVVSVGDRVLKGQVLTDRDDHSICPVHASTSGIIEGIGKYPVAGESLTDAPCVLLHSDGQDQWTELQTADNWAQLDADSLIEKIHQAGIAGLDGPGFPLAQMLRSLQGKALSSLIINAAECEPYITCDQALVRARTADLLTGIRILQQITNARETTIVIDRSKQDAIKALELQLQGGDIRLVRISPRYPSSTEKLLVKRITGKEVPAQGLPSDIGVLVCNAGSAYAVYRAVVQGQPLLSRITTLCGTTLATPKNFEVLVGTPVFFLLELCGIDYARLSRLVSGGALKGLALQDLKVPAGKSTNCLIAASAAEMPERPEALPCIRCGYCAAVCPVSLQPQSLHEFIRNDNLPLAIDAGIRDCIDCGACDWVCPSHIPLLSLLREAQVKLGQQATQRARSEYWQQRYEFRRYRLARYDKEGNRKARSQVDAGVVAPTIPTFDRDKARADIAAAVARVKARRDSIIASNRGAETGGTNAAESDEP